MKKSQTATEYLIILAVVIVISLITIGVLGGVPSIGGGSSKNAKIAEIKNQKIGVDAFYVDGFYGKLKIRNNLDSTISLNKISIDDYYCETFDIPVVLKSGQTSTIECDGRFTDHSGGRTVPKIGFLYKDITTGSLYETEDYYKKTYYDFLYAINRVNNYGGTQHDDFEHFIESGDYLIAVGSSQSDLSSFIGGQTNQGSADFIIAKYDRETLNLVDMNHFGESGYDFFFKVIETKDSYIAAGYSSSDLSSFPGGSNTQGGSDFVVAQFDKKNLNLVSIKNMGGNANDFFHDFIKSGDNYIGVGLSISDLSSFPDGFANGAGDVLFAIVKLDSDFNIIDVNNFGGTGGQQFVSVIETRDHYVAVGDAASDLSGIEGGSANIGGSDYVIAKFDKDTLDLETFNHFGGTGDDVFEELIEVDDSYIGVGYSSSNLAAYPGGTASKGNADALLIKMDKTTLDVIEMSHFGGSGLDIFNEIYDYNDYYYVFGSSYSDLRSYPGGSNSGLDNQFLFVQYNKTNLDVLNVSNIGQAGSDTLLDALIIDEYIYIAGFSWSDLSSYSGGATHQGEGDFLIAKVE